MKQQQVNLFKSKFHLLNSQESSEEIIWSCSDSSDYENYSYNEINLKPGKRKRKQVKNKKNVSSISNLDVTIVDGATTINGNRAQKFPDCVNGGCKSPILTSSQRFPQFTTNKSPVINLSSKENKQVSPVLVLKNGSQKSLPKVRKKLFEHDSINIEKHRERSVSPVLTCMENVVKISKTSNNQKIFNRNKNNKDKFSTDRIKNYQVPNTNIPKGLPHEERENNNHWIKQETQSLNSYRNQKHELLNLTQDTDISIDNKIKSVALIDKVKSYFDSHFSSTPQSQNSISEYESKNSSKSNDDIEIINSLTEEKPLNVKLENRPDQSSDSLKSYNDIYVHQTKKVKYKKDGLAFRLNALLKKQNASNSLWFHERYLAANSNFIVPREDFIAFRIQNVSFKYGCYLLDVLDISNELCFVFINNSYVKSNTVAKDAIFKLYRPYKMLQFEKHKLYINICKYECVVLKK